MTKIRRNVWNLPAGDQTLDWYGRAIGVMQSKPITDPTSWRFQAAIHGYDPANDPLANPGEQLPSSQIQNDFWLQCQHGSWFFLPWHRMYLHFFEQIVTAEVVKLGGPNDWALPYWNYSAANQDLLPVAFRSATLADGSQNYLYVEERNPDCNAGRQFASDFDVSLEPALTQPYFSDSFQGNFGGLQANFSHAGSQPGWLETVPHGRIHDAVGGGFGWWMGIPDTAALDPIFWLHHANIDRLWEVWRQMKDMTHTDPSDPQWRTKIAFSFYDANQQVQTMHCADVEDTTKLDYSYDDVSDPLSAQMAAAGVLPAARAMEVMMPEAIQPELAGATESSSKVQNVPAKIRVPTPLHNAARARREASANAVVANRALTPVAKTRVILQLENITAQGRAGSYDVYINIPDGETYTQHPELMAGGIDLFGVAEASRSSNQHPGSGLTYSLDITKIYNALDAEAKWDPNKVDVHLVPVRKWESAEVTIGRVSLFFG